jgi:hypothetical protein
MDIVDYINWNVIGTNYEEVPCTIWDEMYPTARATFEDYQKAYLEYCYSGCIINGLKYDNLSQKNKVNSFLNTFNLRCEKYVKARNRFFNSLICDANKLTGIVETTIRSGSIAKGQGDTIIIDSISNIRVIANNVSIYVDYTGSNVFSESLYNEYQRGIKEINKSLKEALALFNGATSTQLTTVPAPINGVCAI